MVTERASPIAEVTCAPTAALKDRLAEQFGTTRHAAGLSIHGEVVEIWTDADGHWIVAIIYTSGWSSLLALGEHWQETRPGALAEPENREKLPEMARKN